LSARGGEVKQYIKDIEAAEYLGLAVQTLRNWRCSMTGPKYVKAGKAVRYSIDDLNAYMQQRKVDPENNRKGSIGI
jgi:predicted DNA-binding transcriptional regulator AlpA